MIPLHGIVLECTPVWKPTAILLGFCPVRRAERGPIVNAFTTLKTIFTITVQHITHSNVIQFHLRVYYCSVYCTSTCSIDRAIAGSAGLTCLYPYWPKFCCCRLCRYTFGSEQSVLWCPTGSREFPLCFRGRYTCFLPKTFPQLLYFDYQEEESGREKKKSKMLTLHEHFILFRHYLSIYEWMNKYNLRIK